MNAQQAQRVMNNARVTRKISEVVFLSRYLTIRESLGRLQRRRGQPSQPGQNGCPEGSGCMWPPVLTHSRGTPLGPQTPRAAPASPGAPCASSQTSVERAGGHTRSEARQAEDRRDQMGQERGQDSGAMSSSCCGAAATAKDMGKE